ncbi:MAG: hypothetical protein AB1Z65_11880 [Candidatus Sulfomarinibacteraceae bacterium]
MNRLLVLVVVSMIVAVPSFGSDEGDGENRGWCSLDGGWYGASAFGPWAWTATMTSSQNAVGTVAWTGGNGTWFGYCPDSVRNSIGQGVATRIGPRSFETTFVTFSIAADGSIACIWKATGWVELDRGCEAGVLNGEIQLYNADQDPFSGEPFVCFPEGPNQPFVRMTVDPVHPICP